MNLIFTLIFLLSLVIFSFFSPGKALSAMTDGGQKALSLSMSLIVIYSIWSGILQIAEDSGIVKKISIKLKPLIKKLFSDPSDDETEDLAVNIAANILGMGNAATPMGVKAMRELDEENGTPFHASDAMCMLVVLNTTSFQLIPSTIIALRTAAGSQSPLDIIVPIWIASAVSVVCAVMITKLVCRMWRK